MNQLKIQPAIDVIENSGHCLGPGDGIPQHNGGDDGRSEASSPQAAYDSATVGIYTHPSSEHLAYWLAVSLPM